MRLFPLFTKTGLSNIRAFIRSSKSNEQLSFGRAGTYSRDRPDRDMGFGIFVVKGELL
jgi:hypothetical protein